MTANMLRALAKGKLVVTNITHTEVIVYFPGDDGKLRNRLFRPAEKVDLTSEVSVNRLRKSPNLGSLVKTAKLRVEM
jgi:hypothetical protein